MSQENVEIARAALNAFAELDEGLVGPEQVAQLFGQDPITTFSGFEAFLGKQARFTAPMSSSSSAPHGWSRMTTSSTSR
jgi:hypothetical protein